MALRSTLPSLSRGSREGSWELTEMPRIAAVTASPAWLVTERRISTAADHQAWASCSTWLGPGMIRG